MDSIPEEPFYMVSGTVDTDLEQSGSVNYGITDYGAPTRTQLISFFIATITNAF